MSARQSTFISFRVTPNIDSDLRRVAEREANPVSAVARRFIAEGLSREKQSGSDNDPKSEQSR